MNHSSRLPSTVCAFSLAAGATLLTNSALACGGFFCSQSAPVFQAAERIIFAQDGEHVTQIVEVLYEGPSEKFSWVLPVPGIPVPDVSSKQVFDRLDAATAPRYILERDYSCFNYNYWYAGGDVGLTTGSPTAEESSPPPVTVLDAGSVGPFDYETISINVDDDPAAVAVEWLQDNGYDVTETTGDLLGPYLANGLNLIAFRLQKGQSSGAIRPIVLEYEAEKMAIPIRPTSVAANNDMPVLVWTLGAHRAVPTNYYGLEINELLIDWFNPSSSYEAVVTAAANESGGQGFVTELATDAGQFADMVAPTETDIDNVFAANGNLEDTLSSIVRQLGTWDGFLESASTHIALRDGVTIEEFVGCSYCYFHPENYDEETLDSLGLGGAANVGQPIGEDDPVFDTDLTALEASLRETVIQPLLDAGDLLTAHDTITRLYTTMSADEMTVDPTFEFNPDLEDVENQHTAVQEWNDPDSCSSEEWTITLEDGTRVYGEGTVWPHALGDTDLKANARILQFSVNGAPAVVTDLQEDNMNEHMDTPAGAPPTTASETAGSGGGCSVAPNGRSDSWFWIAVSGLALGMSGRRRSTAR